MPPGIGHCSWALNQQAPGAKDLATLLTALTLKASEES